MRWHLPASVEVDDLVGAGALGLLDAVDKFDSAKQAKLQTYARRRILGSMLDSLRALDPVPRSLRMKGRRIEELYRELGNRLGRAVHDEEMADALGVDLQEWNKILSRGEAPPRPYAVCLRARHGEGGDGVADLASSREGPFELLFRREQRDILEQALAGLPERERAVVTLYYRNELTMRQIASRLGVDESRISQIHSHAVARLSSRVQALLCPAAGVRPMPGSVAARHDSTPLPSTSLRESRACGKSRSLTVPEQRRRDESPLAIQT